MMLADLPWEGERVYPYGSIDFDPVQGRLKMWCRARLGPGYESCLPGLDRLGDLILRAASEWSASSSEDPSTCSPARAGKYA